MKDCNIISLTKVKSIESQNVEFSKVMSALLNNYKINRFENTLTQEQKDALYDIFTIFVNDIISIHNTFADELTMDIDYILDELEISVNFIQTGQDLNDSLFDQAIAYSEKYEELVINHGLAGVLFIDFNTMTRNENLHIITKYSDGTVIDNGKTRK